MRCASAKSWKARLAAGLFCLVPLHALAAPTPEIVVAVQAKLDEALAEQKVFLNCLATSEYGGGVTEQSWRQEFEQALAMLREANFPDDMVSDFAAEADPEALLMADSTFAEVIAFCRSQPDWLNKRYRLQYIILPLVLPQVIAGN